MSRSSFSTPPSRCSRSTAPRSSSCGDRIGWFSPTCMPNIRSIQRTSASIADRASARAAAQRQRIGRATSSAPRSGALIATVFGRTSAKTTTSDGHDDGRVDDADIAEPRQQQAGGKRGRGDIDHIVAEQDARRSAARAMRQQLVDDVRASRLPSFSSRSHARARGGGQRGLARRKRRTDSSEADENRQPMRNPVVLCHRPASLLGEKFAHLGRHRRPAR